MKKNLVITLASVFVLSIGSTAFAATANPFVDLPAKHWAYDSVMELAKVGIVEGYGDGTFGGDKTITRYEMAEIVAKAMVNSDKADAAQKITLNKLVSEFKDELTTLGVRVDKLEKKADKVKWSGYARVLYDNTTKNGKFVGKDLQMISRLEPVATLNNDWTWRARIQNVQNLLTSGQSSALAYNGGNETTTSFEYVNISGPVLGTTATLGRMTYIPVSGSPVYGTNIECKLDGVKFEFGNALKTTVYYGKEDAKLKDSNGALKDTALYGVGFNYNWKKDTNLTGGLVQYKAESTNIAALKLWEAGFDTKLASDLKLKVNYGKANTANNNKAYYVNLTYKKADLDKSGSWETWVNYRNIEQNAIYGGTATNGIRTTNTNWDLPLTKSFEVGYIYVPVKNLLWKTSYVDGKSTEIATKDQKQKYFSSYLEFHF